MSLPIPTFSSVKEISSAVQRKGSRRYEVLFIIALDKKAGHKARYSAIMLDRTTGTADCIGRELTLDQARREVYDFTNRVEKNGRPWP